MSATTLVDITYNSRYVIWMIDVKLYARCVLQDEEVPELKDRLMSTYIHV